MVRLVIWRVGQRRLEVWITETGARSAVLLDADTLTGCWPLPSRVRYPRWTFERETLVRHTRIFPPRSLSGGSKRAGDYSLFWEAMALGVLGDLMQHQAAPRSRLLIECARASVDPRTVRKLLAGQPVRPLAAERAARVIARLNLTPEMFP